jgi:hypothetical protein
MAVNKIAALLRQAADYLAPVDAIKLDAYLAGPAFDAVWKAVEKQEKDPVLRDASHDAKRAEALLWAEYYGTRKHCRPDAWATRFLVEFVVGLQKGKFKP